MRISLNWLKTYVDLPVAVEDLAHRLTMAGLEVEKIERPGDQYENIVIGEVTGTAKHPNADKLTLCSVNVGKEVLQIVCGAPNVAPGQKVVVGLLGATIPHNQHDPSGSPFSLSAVKIRGVASQGMICSEYELSLGDDKDRILILEKNSKTGQNIADYLGLNDTILEIGITPNRPDAMSHIGVAREVAALVGRKLKIPSIRLKEGKRLAKTFAKLKIHEPALCPRYTARLVFDITVRPSPPWMQQYLRAAGIRPINNVVDVTNFVLMETGHPLHAFDYDKLAGAEINVRLAPGGKPFTTLDHKSRVLSSSTLVICDAEHEVAIAGIMGGLDAEISENSKNILIESAYFSPQGIRRSSKVFGLSTDASQRFERGADPNMTLWAANRAAQLIQDICGGEVLKGALDVYPRKITDKKVCLRPERLNNVLGTDLTARQISGILKRIDIHPAPATRSNRSPGTVYYSIPSFRPDLEQEIDLIEEVARIFGYDNIQLNNQTRITFSHHAPEPDFLGDLKSWLTGSGYSEIVSNSMEKKAVSSLASDAVVEIANPISNEMATLRTSLVLSSLQVIRNNIFNNNKNLRLFEVGKTYFQTGRNVGLSGYREERHLLLVHCGVRNKASWDNIPSPVDLYDVKGEVHTLFRKIFLDNIKFIPYSTTKALTSVGFDIEFNDVRLGQIGKVRKDILGLFEIEEEVFVSDLDLDALLSKCSAKRTFKSLPKYPFVTRDIAFEVQEDISSGQVENEVRNAGGILLKKVELFDIYRGDQLRPGEKSLAFALEFLSHDHTLTQGEVDLIMKNIVAAVSRNLGGTLRE